MANHIIEEHLDTQSFHKSLTTNGIKSKVITDSDGSCKVSANEDDTIEFFLNNADSYIFDKSFLDKLFSPTSVGQMYLEASYDTDLVLSDTYYKLAGNYSDGGMNVNWSTATTNKLTCNKQGKYLFNASGLLKVDKACIITLAIFIGNTLIYEASKSFPDIGVEATVSKNRIFNSASGSDYILYAKSNQTNTVLTVDEIEMMFTEIKQY